MRVATAFLMLTAGVASAQPTATPADLDISSIDGYLIADSRVLVYEGSQLEEADPDTGWDEGYAGIVITGVTYNANSSAEATHASGSKVASGNVQPAAKARGDQTNEVAWAQVSMYSDIDFTGSWSPDATVYDGVKIRAEHTGELEGQSFQGWYRARLKVESLNLLGADSLSAGDGCDIRVKVSFDASQIIAYWDSSENEWSFSNVVQYLWDPVTESFMPSYPDWDNVSGFENLDKTFLIENSIGYLEEKPYTIRIEMIPNGGNWTVSRNDNQGDAVHWPYIQAEVDFSGT